MRNLERKKEIRKHILEVRSQKSREEWKTGTDKIMKAVTGHPWFLEADALYCYVDFKGEAGTRGIIERAWELRKKVYVPAVTGDDMSFYRIFSFEELKEGAFGIPEPQEPEAGEKKDEAFCGSVLMIMPGVAFDRKRNRVGYGGGYYDRYLACYTEFYIHTIAVAFECQIVEEIETEETDVKPELLITERRIL